MRVMKFKLLPVAAFVALLLMVLAAAVLAQEEIEVPPPYAGLENPFPWDDTSAQEAGMAVFQEFCAACHVATEDVPALGPEFSAVDYRQSLEERADFYFWTVSEGRLDKGMPPWGLFFSEEERWQVLTYIWSLGGEVPPTTTPPPDIEGGTLLLTVPGQAQSGQPLTIAATLQDEEGQPVAGATVKFFLQMDFFASSLMDIGEVVTDEQGVAVLEYTPRQTGDIQVIAHYERGGLSPIEATTMLTLAEADGPFYQAQAGLRSFSFGEEVLIGPKSALELVDGAAPAIAFRLPGGILSWLLILVGVVALIWFTYFRVLYQVFRIPIVSEMRDTNTRLVPVIGLTIVAALGFLLLTMLLTGPYSHLHLLR